MKKTACILAILYGISAYGQLTNTMTWSDPTCNGDCDGTATANPAGGSSPYFYLWSSNTGNQTTRVASGLCAGSYTVTLTDNNSNIVISNVTLSSPPSIGSTLTQTPVSCNGNSDGAADLTPSGGMPNSALGFNGANDYVVADIVSGAGYANGITVEAWVWPDPSWTSSDAMIIAFNTSGFNNHFFMGYNATNNRFLYFDNVAGNRFSASTYPPGVWYHVAVSITAGNFMRLYVNGVQEATFITTNVWLPNASSLFSIGQEWDGPNLPSQFWWGRIDEVRVWNMALSAGTILSNYSQCCPVTPSHPNYANLVAYYSMNEGSGNNVGDRSGNGNSGRYINGATWMTTSNAAYACFSEGTGYHYEWNTTETSEDIMNLSAGVYTVTLSDGNCCSATDVITVTEPSQLSVNGNAQDVSCYGGTDGMATVSASGGTSPYTYQWDMNTGNQTAQTATGLAQGTYYVTITDNNGCTALDSVTVSAPPMLTDSSSVSDAICYGDSSGYAAVYVSGGTSPYFYNWSTAGTGGSEDSLAAGMYIVTITDSNGCSLIDTVIVAQPAPLSPMIVSFSNATCNNDCDGSVVLQTSGGTSPYVYQWSNSETGDTITGLCAGTYFVTISDSNACDTVMTIVISEPPPLISDFSQDTTICEGDTIILSFSGSGNILWSTGDTLQSIEVSPSSNTSYQVVVNSGPCSDSALVWVNVEQTHLIDARQDTTISKGATVLLYGSGGNALYWWPSTWLSCTSCATPFATPEATITYYLSDSASCSTTDSVIIYVLEGKNAFLPNIFSPNGDGNNDILYVRGNGIAKATMLIYDRWGEKIFESNDMHTGWDGTYHGKPVNAGVYVYLVRLSYFDGSEQKLKGSITLIR